MKKQAYFLFLFALLFFSASALPAQSDWFEDDDDEEVVDADESEAWDIAAGKESEVKIKLNGEMVELGNDYTFRKKDTLDIKVRHLAPGSGVVLHIKKGGIKLKKKAFYANHRGQLDLEVRTGGKKVGGTAVVHYTTSSGRKVEREVKIQIE